MLSLKSWMKRARGVVTRGGPNEILANPALALLPALIVGIAAMAFNHFALIDDGVMVAAAVGRHSLQEFFKIGESGRFFPLYWVYHWLLFMVFPVAPWVLSFFNAVALLTSAWLIVKICRVLGHPAAAVPATWLFILNLATAENLFTLSKAEPKQLCFWLYAVLLMVEAVGGRPLAGWFRLVTFCLAVAGACLFKESGILLAVPLILFIGAALLPSFLAPRRSMLIAGLGGLATLIFCLLPFLRHGLGAHGYAREHVLAGQNPSLLHFSELLNKNFQLSVLLLCGLLACALLCFFARGVFRSQTLLLCAQLAACVLFFALLSAIHPYYLLPLAAFSALTIGLGISQGLLAAANYQRALIPAVIVLVAWGGLMAWIGASALTSWSWLHAELGRAVTLNTPPRVLFHLSGSPENHSEADLTWRQLGKLPIQVGVLDTPESEESGTLHVRARDLRPGDWILEEFGTLTNQKFPLRDLGVTRPSQQALLGGDRHPLLPLRMVRRMRADFPGMPRWQPHPRFPATNLEWRIYEMTGTPSVLLEDLGSDLWMFAEATVAVKANMVTQPLYLRSRAFRPPDGSGNRMLVWNGTRQVADCPSSAGITECRITPAAWADNRDAYGWVELKLRAEHTYSPAELGIGSDNRHFSFNFEPTYAAGLSGIFVANPNERAPPPMPAR